MKAPMPVIFGVLTTENIEQAVERAGTKAGNKGVDAAMAALEMVSVYSQLGGGRNGDRDGHAAARARVRAADAVSARHAAAALRRPGHRHCSGATSPRTARGGGRAGARSGARSSRSPRSWCTACASTSSRSTRRSSRRRSNWRLERMARVDRNLLRLAVYELKHVDDVPAKVAINEAIEIAKRFGTSESSAFVNGILDRCREELGKK